MSKKKVVSGVTEGISTALAKVERVRKCVEKFDVGMAEIFPELAGTGVKKKRKYTRKVQPEEEPPKTIKKKKKEKVKTKKKKKKKKKKVKRVEEDEE